MKIFQLEAQTYFNLMILNANNIITIIKGLVWNRQPNSKS